MPAPGAAGPASPGNSREGPVPEPSRARHVPVVNEGPIESTCPGRCQCEVSTWKLPGLRAGFRCTTPAVLPVGADLLRDSSRPAQCPRPRRIGPGWGDQGGRGAVAGVDAPGGPTLMGTGLAAVRHTSVSTWKPMATSALPSNSIRSRSNKIAARIALGANRL